MKAYDIWGGLAPEVEKLVEFREYMANCGLNVRQIYHPPTEWSEGEWVVSVERREKLDDERVWFWCTEVSNKMIAWGMSPGWELLADLMLRQVPDE